MNMNLRHIGIIPYLVIVFLFFLGALWLHKDDVEQREHNRIDCLIQTNHAIAINKVIDNIVERIVRDPTYTPAEKKARIAVYLDSKAVVPTCNE